MWYLYTFSLLDKQRLHSEFRVQTLRIENYESISCVTLLLYDYGWRTDCHVTVG